MEQFIGDNEETGEDDQGPFPQAIIDNDTALVRAFIESGIDLEERYGKVHKTALMIAAAYNRYEIIDILLKEGCANLYARDDYGEIAFFWASWNDQVEALRALHLAGCDLSDRDSRTDEEGLSTALFKATTNGRFGSVRYLVDAGADIMCLNNYNTPPYTSASCHGSPEILDFLLSHMGVDIDHRNVAGLTALHMAAQWGEIACLNICLDHKANVEIEDRNGWTPLFCAAWKGRHATVRQLVERVMQI
jgi:ankyrin repeat protein